MLGDSGRDLLLVCTTARARPKLSEGLSPLISTTGFPRLSGSDPRIYAELIKEIAKISACPLPVESQDDSVFSRDYKS